MRPFDGRCHCRRSTGSEDPFLLGGTCLRMGSSPSQSRSALTLSRSCHWDYVPAVDIRLRIAIDESIYCPSSNLMYVFWNRRSVPTDGAKFNFSEFNYRPCSFSIRHGNGMNTGGVFNLLLINSKSCFIHNWRHLVNTFCRFDTVMVRVQIGFR